MPVVAAGSPPLLSPAATCRVLVGGTPGCPPLPRLGPAHVIPRIRQSWAEPLVIPSGVGQGSAPPCLSVLGVTRGDSWGSLHRDTAPEGQGTGTPSREHPQDTQLRLGIHRWDHVGTAQGHLYLGKDRVGTARDHRGGGVGTPTWGQSAHRKMGTSTHPRGQFEGTRDPGDIDTQGVTPTEGHPLVCEGHLPRDSSGVTLTQRDRGWGVGRVPAPTARQRVLHLCAGACWKWVRLCRARGWLRTPQLP